MNTEYTDALTPQPGIIRQPVRCSRAPAGQAIQTDSEEREMNCYMNIIYIITALSAAGAAIFAGLTWRSSKKFREEENLSRRAYLTPADEPGYMVISDDPLDIDPVIKIVLINSGTNPCKDINILMLAYNRTVVDDKSPCYISS